jgi:hypothetical protein
MKGRSPGGEMSVLGLAGTGASPAGRWGAVEAKTESSGLRRLNKTHDQTEKGAFA